MSKRENREICYDLCILLHTICISSSDVKIDKQVMRANIYSSRFKTGCGAEAGTAAVTHSQGLAWRILSYKCKVRDNIISVYIEYHIHRNHQKKVSTSYPALSSLHALPWRVCWKSRIRELRTSRVQFRTFLRRPIRLAEPRFPALFLEKRRCHEKTMPARITSSQWFTMIILYWHC